MLSAMTTQPLQSFATSTPEDAAEEPIPFELTGVYAQHVRRKGGTAWKETFKLSPIVQARVASIISNVYVVVEGEEIQNPDLVQQFFYVALVPDSAVAFRRLVNDPDRLVRAELLANAFEWCCEQLNERPTPPS
jgi:hypothetical protein